MGWLQQIGDVFADPVDTVNASEVLLKSFQGLEQFFRKLAAILDASQMRNTAIGYFASKFVVLPQRTMNLRQLSG